MDNPFFCFLYISIQSAVCDVFFRRAHASTSESLPAVVQFPPISWAAAFPTLFEAGFGSADFFASRREKESELFFADTCG